MTGPAQIKTTIYVPASIAASLKVVAARTGTTFNAAVVEALRGHLAEQPSELRDDEVSRLGEALARLSERVAALESSNAVDTMAGAGERIPIDAAGIRREAEHIIRKLGRPVPHSEMKSLLEERFYLPGLRPTENLRTILVHPKAPPVFELVRKQGYRIRK